MAEMRFRDALNRALADAMEADPSVILFGEDIARFGGSFGVTKTLQTRFGNERVRDAPISESAIAGAAVGAAMTGLRPVIEIMFMDFVTFAMDAIVNQAAKARFMFGGNCSVPMVVRTPHGGGISAGPQHSQCLEAWFAHVPGLRVLCPGTVEDCYALMRAAIDDPDPTIFVENKAIYSIRGDLPDSVPPAIIGKAKIERPGRDVTVVTYGACVDHALAAADDLAETGIEIEVINLRSIQPWDEAMVLQSLTRTHRLVIFHEATEAFGVGAEIAARVADRGFDDLDAPIIRVGAPFMPAPFSSVLDREFLPRAPQLVDAVRRVLA